MRTPSRLLVLSLIGLSALVGRAAPAQTPEGWHGSLKDGLAAAAKSGRAVLVITAWKPGI